jgi:hypothetical protein
VPEILTVTDQENVVSWRLHVLLQVGYSIRAAELLADSNVDLHEAVELVEKGCPPETAARILI